MLVNDYFNERERWDAQTAENSARYAWAWGTAHTLGWGEVIIEEPIMFELTFVEQPTVQYGFALDDDDQTLDADGVLLEGRLPRCTGGVLHWVRNNLDFYIGAHVYLCVATADPMLAAQAWVEAALAPSTAVDPDTGVLGVPVLVPPDAYLTDPGYDITHSFTFQGIAIKDVAS